MAVDNSLLTAANHGKRQLLLKASQGGRERLSLSFPSDQYKQGRTYVHLCVEVGHCLVVSWEGVDLYAIAVQLLHDL